MKQNERILVYAVTGFLALILVVAVIFGNEPGVPLGGSKVDGSQLGGSKIDDSQRADPMASATGAAKDGSAGDLQGLSELLGAAKPKTGVPPAAGLPAPKEVTPEQPLVAAPKPMLAADLVAQQLGPSRRDRTVRFVRARAGDSLETLVRRWCGARDPFLEEARLLNEDLVVVKLGQEVAVPWVEDDVVLAAHEARQPKPAVPAANGDAPSTTGETGGSLVDALAGLAAAPPRSGAQDATATRAPIATESLLATKGGTKEPATSTNYTVKKGDAWWKLSARIYGRSRADEMLPELRRLNPDAGDTLKIGQKIVLPAAEPAGR